MKKILLLTGTLLAGAWQAGFAQFQHGLGDVNFQVGRSVQHTPFDNGYIVAGFIRGTAPLGLTDGNVTKTNTNGNVLWSTAIGRHETELFHSIRETGTTATPARYVTAGHTRSFGFGSDDMYLVGLNAVGIPVFSRTYGGANVDRGYCIQRISDPNQQPGYVIVGDTRSFPSFFPGANVYVVRTDINGNSLDQAVIGTSAGDDTGYWIEQTRDGGYLVAGTTTQRCPNDTITNNNIFVLRLDRFLNILWNRIISGPGSQSDVAYCVRENVMDNSVIVTGTTRSWGNEAESFLLNLSPAGGFNWMRVYGGKEWDNGQNVLLTTDPNNNPQYLVSGFSNSFNTTLNYNPMLFKTDLSGNLLWTRQYGGPAHDYGYEPDGVPPAAGGPALNYVLTGFTRSFTHGGDDILLLVTDNFGKSGGPCEKELKQEEKRVEPCITANAQAVQINPWQVVQSSYVRLQYSQIRCTTPSPFAAQTETPAPDEAAIPSSITVGPNPTTSVVNFRVDKSFAGSTLSVVDGSGAVVYTTTIEDESVSLDLGRLNPGLYIARILKPDGTLTTIRVLKK